MALRDGPKSIADSDTPRAVGPPAHNHAVHCVYIVRCADGTLYTGYARDPDAREKVHNSGRGARYTSGRRPVVLVYRETCKSRGDALRREHQLKRWSRRRKEVLIASVADPRPSVF
jgi:putative endonuclease